MTLDDFVKKYDGVGIDFDGAYGFQCMDLAHRYAVDVVGQDIPAVPAAKDEWTKNIPGYDKIANSPTGLPQKGDIIIWGTEVGAYGHIAIFLEGNLNTFTSFDQNWPINSLCHKQQHSYGNTSQGVLGWFHPQKTAVDAVSVPKDTFENLVRKSGEYDKVCVTFGFDNATNNSGNIKTAFEKIQSDLLASNKSLKEVEAENATIRKERDKAVSNVCPNPSAHTPSSGDDSTGTDTPPVVLPPIDSGDSSTAPPVGEKNFIETFILAFINFFKK
jgi:hypothetical protein